MGRVVGRAAGGTVRSEIRRRSPDKSAWTIAAGPACRFLRHPCPSVAALSSRRPSPAPRRPPSLPSLSSTGPEPEAHLNANPHPDPDRLLRTALEAAAEATEIHRSNLGRVRPGDAEEKGASDFVTYVDHEAESRIVARIRTTFPDHRILAEEGGGDPVGGPEGAGSGWLWVIDPLDGTTNFLHGYPAYSVSIAALRDGVAEVGVVASAATGETWTAVRGRGAFRDGEPIRVSDVDRLGPALIGTGFPFKALDRLPLYLRQFDRILRRTSGIRRAGSAALDLCHVASGYLDGFWELVLAPWDIAAGSLMVREAGGIVTRMDGSEPGTESGSLLAGNPAVYAALGDILSQDNDL